MNKYNMNIYIYIHISRQVPQNIKKCQAFSGSSARRWQPSLRLAKGRGKPRLLRHPSK